MDIPKQTDIVRLTPYGGAVLIVKEIRKGMKELKSRNFPYRHDYHYGFHDAIELCNKLIEKTMKKAARNKEKMNRS